MKESEEERGPNNQGLFDLDGSIADFDGTLQTGMNAIASPNDPKITDFAKEEDEPEWMANRRRLIKGTPGFWENLPRLDLGFHILEIAEKLQFHNMILSKGPRKNPNAWAEKVRWCTKNVPTLPVILSDEKWGQYGKFLCDDWPDYFLPWLKNRPRGWVIAVTQRWNSGVEHPRLIRYDGTNLEQVREVLTILRATCNDMI